MDNSIAVNEVLVWLSGGGAAVFLSWLLERSKWFQKIQDPDKKHDIHFYGSFVIAMLAVAITQFVPADVLATLSPFFTAFVAWAVVFGLNQLAHKANPNRNDIWN